MTTRLNRALTLGPVVLFGLAYMAPVIVLGTFGELADSSGDAVPTAYLLALVAMLFTAVSYGRMAAAFRSPAPPTRTPVRPSTRGPASWSAGPCCWTTSSCRW